MSHVRQNGSAHEVVALDSPQASPRQSLNWTISYRAVAPVAMVCDAVIIFAMCILSSVAYNLETIGTRGDIVNAAGFAAVVAALFISLSESRDLYKPSELLNLKSQFRRITPKWIGIFLFLTAVAFTMKIGETFSRGATLSFAASGLAALIGVRIVWRIVLANGLAVRNFSGRKIALIAQKTLANGSDFLEALARHGLQPAHHFVLPSSRKDAKLWKDFAAEIISSIRGSDIEEIIMSANLDHWPELNHLLSELRVLPLPVNFVPIGPTSELFNLPSSTIGDTITIELQRGPRTLFERLIKRVLDVLIAGIMLVVLLPLMLITAVAIKLDSAGPIIFRQRRCGFNGRKFQILKFRTMSVLEDGEAIVQAGRKDTRVTRLGKWLRRTSIDELPQLFNILWGEMSVVGPRPHAVAHDNQFDQIVRKYAYRQHAKPGLTGWAQVNGYRGETRTVADIQQRVQLDLWYIDNWSLALDFKIITMTVIEIVRGQNAY
jgi:Undecaprenyl-phosphate glucose phosphotransferase